MRSIVGKTHNRQKWRPHADYLGWRLRMSVNERQKQRYEGEEETKTKKRGPRLGPFTAGPSPATDRQPVFI